MLNTFCPGRGSKQDLMRGRQTLYSVAIKAGLYRKAVQVCIIPNISTNVLFETVHSVLLFPLNIFTDLIWNLLLYFYSYGVSLGRIGSGHMTKLAAMPIYGDNLYKLSSPEPMVL